MATLFYLLHTRKTNEYGGLAITIPWDLFFLGVIYLLASSH